MTIANHNFAPDTKSPDQKGNKDWWEINPMTYDWSEGNTQASREWFERLDDKFWSISEEFAHPNFPDEVPFSRLLNYSELLGKNVLEIGCGMGSHAALFTTQGMKVTAIDLTQHAIDMTNERFRIFNITNATAQLADAEKMPFPDESFDFVWSWGVIHHSANTEQIISEIHRVLKPEGKAKIMVYYKNSTRYYIHGLFQGIFKLKFLKYRTLYEVNMTYTDGFIARHFTKNEANKLFLKFNKCSAEIMDSGVPSVIYGWGRLSKFFPKIFSPLNKFINRKWGWFLVIEVQK